MGKVGTKGEGNYLGKARRNFLLTNKCWDLMHEMCLELGLNHGQIIELAVREMYPKICGKPVTPIIDEPRKRFDF